MIIVLGNFQHPLARHRPASQDVFEERNHFFARLRTTEGNQQ
jgi:hypothetical protein